MRIENLLEKLNIAYKKIEDLESQLFTSKEDSKQLSETIDEMIPELRSLNKYKKDMEMKGDLNDVS